MKGSATSKTIWVNVLALVASLLAVLAGSDLLANQETALAVIIGVQGAVNIALRLVTKQPIEKGALLSTAKVFFTLASRLWKRKKPPTS